jgi:hypothetical protein
MNAPKDYIMRHGVYCKTEMAAGQKWLQDRNGCRTEMAAGQKWLQDRTGFQISECMYVYICVNTV